MPKIAPIRRAMDAKNNKKMLLSWKLDLSLFQNLPSYVTNIDIMKLTAAPLTRSVIIDET
jgi:hypothetical protein